MEIIHINRLDRFNAPSFYSENIYQEIRIPGIVCLNGGDLLCYYECRRGGDWSPIDIGMQRSADGGRTWSSTRIIADGKGRNACNNPVMIQDGDTLWFLYCENYKRLFLSKSINGGETFSAPLELTHTVDALSAGRFWSVLAAGPGHGVALKDHTLFIPIWFGDNKKDMFAHHPSYVRVLQGIGGGREWTLSLPIGENTLKDPSECCIAALPDGKLILNIRNEGPACRRAVCFGDAGKNTWSEPQFDMSLPDPVCAAGLCSRGNALLFTNCRDTRHSKHLSIIETDEKGTVSDVLEISERGGYSDVCYSAASSNAYVAFESGVGHISVAEIKL